MKDRVRLFQAVVTPVVLYASATWALRQDVEKQLRTAWRRMLRYVFRIFRQKSTTHDGEQETWVEYIQGAARKVHTLAQRYGVEEWTRTHRRKKWSLAGRLARANDRRWSQQILSWKPNYGVGRHQGRPFTRWSDHLERYAGGNWQQIAEDVGLWAILEEGFLECDG